MGNCGCVLSRTVIKMIEPCFHNLGSFLVDLLFTSFIGVKLF